MVIVGERLREKQHGYIGIRGDRELSECVEGYDLDIEWV